MELDWTTFWLEIVNFLVLVWLLKRFLYRPVADAVARRRAAIERSVSEARSRAEQAEGLERQYRGRLANGRPSASAPASPWAKRSRRSARGDSPLSATSSSASARAGRRSSATMPRNAHAKRSG